MDTQRYFPRGRNYWASLVIAGCVAFAVWACSSLGAVALAQPYAENAFVVSSLAGIHIDNHAIAMGRAPDRSIDFPSSGVDSVPAIDSSADFVPGQILVKYRDGGRAEALTQSLLSDRARLVQPPSTANSPALIQLNDLEGLSPDAAKEKTLDAIAELEASEDVLYAEPNFVFSIQ